MLQTALLNSQWSDDQKVSRSTDSQSTIIRLHHECLRLLRENFGEYYRLAFHLMIEPKCVDDVLAVLEEQFSLRPDARLPIDENDRIFNDAKLATCISELKPYIGKGIPLLLYAIQSPFNALRRTVVGVLEEWLNNGEKPLEMISEELNRSVKAWDNTENDKEIKKSVHEMRTASLKLTFRERERRKHLDLEEIEELDRAVHAYPPDWDTIKRLIERGVDVNEGIYSGPVLGLIYHDYLDEVVGFERKSDEAGWKSVIQSRGIDGRYLPEITRYFLDHGFDVNRYDHAYGAESLYYLAQSSYDDYAVECAKMLLDAGADVDYYLFDDDATLLEQVTANMEYCKSKSEDSFDHQIVASMEKLLNLYARYSQKQPVEDKTTAHLAPEDQVCMDSLEVGAHKADEPTIERKKKIGYLASQYYKIETSLKELPQFENLFDEFAEKAKHTAQPCWYVKGATLYFTYKEKYYEVWPGRLDCTGEVFEELVDELIDRMYELGAYDMFYAGMMD